MNRFHRKARKRDSITGDLAIGRIMMPGWMFGKVLGQTDGTVQ